MISFSKIKNIPEFEFLDKASKMDILRSYLETYIDSYKKLDAESKRTVEKEIFAFYGINVKSTKKVVSKAFDNIKIEIEGVKDSVKTVEGETSKTLNNISKSVEKNRPKDLSSDFDSLKELLASNTDGAAGDVKAMLKAIAKNKPKDISPKIDELAGMVANSKSETKEAIKVLLREISKTMPVGCESKIDELKIMMGNTNVEVAIRNLTEEISKPKSWEFKVERDFRDLIENITAVQTA